MKLHGRSERKLTKSKNVVKLEITEVVLIYVNIFINQYQHDSNVLSTFVPSKSFSQVLNVSPTNHVCSAICHSYFYHLPKIWVKVWAISMGKSFLTPQKS